MPERRVGSYKQEEAYRDFSHRVHGAASRERRITNAQLELTYGCNLHCVHCYTDCYNRPDLLKRELTADEWEHIFDELHALGVLWVGLTGGEVLARSEFRRLYLAAKARGFIVTLLTNATLITEELADFLAEHPPLKLEISCHGATSPTFDAVTQVPGSFVKFCDGMRRLRARGISYRIKTKAMTLNHDELPAIEQFVTSLGAQFEMNGTIYPRLNGDLMPAQYRLSPEQRVVLECGALDDDRCGDETPARCAEELQPPSSDRLYRCGCGGWSVHINAWGALSACTWFREPRVSLRDVSVAEAVEQCFAQIRRARYVSGSPCRTCRVYTFCEKMPAAAWAETPGGDMEQPVKHFCETAYARARVITNYTESIPT